MPAPTEARRTQRSRLGTWLRRLGLAACALALAGWAARCALTRDPGPGFAERRGAVAAVEIQEELVDGDHRTQRLRVVSTSGLTFEAAVRGPAEPGDEPRPLVVLLGGRRTGRDAVDLIPDTRGALVAAVSYPYAGDPRVKGLALVGAAPSIRRALADTVPAVQLLLDHLLATATVDPTRVELVGVSLGAPFACVAGGADERFRRVWAVHGGGDLPRLLECGLRRRLSFTPLRVAIAHVGHALVFGDALAPERWVPRIAPRHFVMINAEDDERIPRECVEVVFDAAGEPKELVWLAGAHIDTDEEDVVLDLVERVLDRVFE